MIYTSTYIIHEITRMAEISLSDKLYLIGSLKTLYHFRNVQTLCLLIIFLILMATKEFFRCYTSLACLAQLGL